MLHHRFAFRPFIALLMSASLVCGASRGIDGQEVDVEAAGDVLPEAPQLMEEMSSDGVEVYREGRTLWLIIPKPEAMKWGKAVIPRICAPIRSMQWKALWDAELKFVPEPEEWVFSWKPKGAVSGRGVIEVVFDTVPVLPDDCPVPAPAGDGSVMLHAYQAATFGEKLRFEPQWYKNTVGYWAVATDYVVWELTIDQPGTFSVAVLQGCGAGQGGSEAMLSLLQDDEVAAELPFRTVETGHFQNFRWNHLGTVSVAEAGSYKLRINAVKIAKNALFDVRAIHLVRQATASE